MAHWFCFIALYSIHTFKISKQLVKIFKMRYVDIIKEEIYHFNGFHNFIWWICHFKKICKNWKSNIWTYLVLSPILFGVQKHAVPFFKPKYFFYPSKHNLILRLRDVVLISKISVLFSFPDFLYVLLETLFQIIIDTKNMFI